jgi:hypothetical protein
MQGARKLDLRKLLSTIAATAALLAAFAPASHAGLLVRSPSSCPSTPVTQPFVEWGDSNYYELVPGGGFESEMPAWTTSNASVVAGNEPFYVRSTEDTSSLSISPGGYATSKSVCVGLDKPTLRFFARASAASLLSSLKVEVLVRTSLGLEAYLPIAVVPSSTNWKPTGQILIVANLLPLFPGSQTPVAFRFKPVGGASWTIDDVYVDPKRR